MVDPLGWIAAALGSCDVILRATKAVAEYVSDVKNAPKNFDRISSEIQNLQAITAALQTFLTSDRVRKQSFESSVPIASAVEKCKAYICELERDFDEKRRRSRLLWPLSGKVDVQKTLQDLNRYVILFHWALSVNGWSFFCKTSEENTKHLEDSLRELQNVVKTLHSIPEMRDEVVSIKDHLVSIQSILEVLADDAYQNAKPDILGVLGKVNEIDDLLQLQTDSLRRKDLLEWLSTDASLQKHRDVSLARQKGTCTWVLESEQYNKWYLDESAVTLWCHGIPGSGKTVIFSAIVDRLLSSENHSSSIVGVIYFDYKEAANHDVSTIFSAILRQFCDKTYTLPEVRKTLTELRELSIQQRKTKLGLEECGNFLKKISKLYQETYLCFDALDELPDPCRYSLMKSLLDLCQYSRIKLLLTSRNNIHLKPRPERVVEQPITATDSDLQTYLEAMIECAESSCLHEKATKTSALRKDIIKTISLKAKGMFLLAELQIRQLEGAITERQIKSMLAALPETIEGQYKSYIERIGGRQQGLIALRALMWVYGSYRPFSPEELLEALSIDDTDVDLDPTGIPTMEAVMNISDGLLTFEKESNTIRLVHETLQEFLNRLHKQILPGCHLMISRSLAIYLNFESFNVSRDIFSPHDWMTLGALRRSHKLLGYAFLHWEHHVSNGGCQATSIGLNVVNRIASNSVLLSFITEAGLLRLPLLKPEGFLPLHVAVLWKSEIIVRGYLGLLSDHDRRLSIDHRSEVGLTALHLAAIVNDVRIAEILIEHGANIDARDKNNRTLLHFAAACSSNDVLGLILSRCSSRTRVLTDNADTDGVRPLHAALQFGNVEGAEELLAAGAQIEAITASGQTALHYAAQFAPGAANLLLERGASIQAVSKNGRDALQWACVGADHDCIRLLLDHGAQPNTKSKDVESPLHLLAKATIELLDMAISLIEMGAVLDDVDEEGSTPLHNAIKTKNFAIAAHLISQGASIQIRTKDGKTPLQLAAAQEDVPDRLWTLLGDVNKQNEHGESYLHLAAKSQSAREVNNLITYGADINIRNQAGETPLHVAVEYYSGHRRSSHRRARSDPVSLLLENGADVNAVTKTGLNATHIALKKRSLPLLKMLFSRNDTMQSRFPDGESMLQFAISSGNASLLEMFLSHGADVNEPCPDMLPLSIAVDCLVREWNAIVPPREQSQYPHPHQASEHNFDKLKTSEASGKLVQSSEKISLLIAYGADPLRADCNGSTPLESLNFWWSRVGPELDKDKSKASYGQVAIAAAISAMRDPKSRIDKRLKSMKLNAKGVEWNDNVPVSESSAGNEHIELRLRRTTEVSVPLGSSGYYRHGHDERSRRLTDDHTSWLLRDRNREPYHGSALRRPGHRRAKKQVSFQFQDKDSSWDGNWPAKPVPAPLQPESKNQLDSCDAWNLNHDELPCSKQLKSIEE